MEREREGGGVVWGAIMYMCVREISCDDLLVLMQFIHY